MRAIMLIIFGSFILMSASAQGPHRQLKGYYGIGDNYKKLPPSIVLCGYESAGRVSAKGYYSFHHPQGYYQLIQWKTAGRQRLFNRKGFYGICKLRH